MKDIFERFATGLESPASHLLAVTPSDTEDLPMASRGINVASSGTVRVTTIGNSTETIFISAGGAFPVRVKRIWSTGTTATGIVVMY